MEKIPQQLELEVHVKRRTAVGVTLAPAVAFTRQLVDVDPGRFEFLQVIRQLLLHLLRDSIDDWR